ncbi:aminopeptidase P N-terminal domain-containing protein [Psychroflexus sp. CAK57W]|uniref:aminopeptidase P family protein n=1 Tax=Psychroflexus curvus TaxID=2873595 RepID=UPI001CCBC7BC|nr:aminopeptidase P family protein [Psychroflexus curvus]MBZ9786885.1 aminopeptidase P N-terminal domain-containing protein [Psychroflexus curvus]
MRYEPISKELFIQNRKNFRSQMLPGSLAVFNSNDIYPIGADSTIPFQQDRNIYYLSGVDQEDSILVLFPDAPDPKHREILFLTETNPHIAVWEGEKLNKERALETSGITTVYWKQDFEKVFNELMAQSHTVYMNTNEHYRAAHATQTREDRFNKWLKENYPAHQVAKSNPILQRLRAVKHPLELEVMQKACNITEKGFRRILEFTKPGKWEYELEAEFMHEFLINKSRGFSYTPIIAGGKNATVLHYIENKEQLKAGDLILIDVGAEYANYASDMTRTIPVSGKYTDRQKQVYTAVNKVKNLATDMLVPGTIWKEFHMEVGKLMTSELLDLKLLDKADVQNENPDWPAYKKYFMHGTSHNIGLDTHDYGLLHEPMKANQVFTVEPGIYLPEENMGIRLEDDVVIQDKGSPKNLMANIPIEMEEIEDLMNNK